MIIVISCVHCQVPTHKKVTTTLTLIYFNHLNYKLPSPLYALQMCLKTFLFLDIMKIGGLMLGAPQRVKLLISFPLKLSISDIYLNEYFQEISKESLHHDPGMFTDIHYFSS